MPYEWEFGERMRVARVKAGMSQSQLCKFLNVSQNTISRRENGHTLPNAHQIYLTAKALGVSAGWLIAGEGEACK